MGLEFIIQEECLINGEVKPCGETGKINHGINFVVDGRNGKSLPI